MVRLASGVDVTGDAELVYRAVDEGQAGGDGLYVADLVEATELSEQQVRVAVAGLVDQEVLAPVGSDDQLGPRYVLSRAV